MCLHKPSQLVKTSGDKDNIQAHQSVCIHENTFGVIREGPAVQLCQCDTQIRPLHHSQVSCVTTVQNIHNLQLVKDVLQHRPNERTL